MYGGRQMLKTGDNPYGGTGHVCSWLSSASYSLRHLQYYCVSYPRRRLDHAGYDDSYDVRTRLGADLGRPAACLHYPAPGLRDFEIDADGHAVDRRSHTRDGAVHRHA